MARADLTGMRFGKLIALSYVGDRKWLCQCDCGNQTHSNDSNLKAGKSTSCGCTKGEKRRIDLTGQRFSNLTVIGHVKLQQWLCQCDCGNKSIVNASNLKSGNTTSCGCNKERDLLGQRFANLTVIRHVPKGGKAKNWECQCDCGNKLLVSANHLVSGFVKSCGCRKSRVNILRNLKHGEAHTRIFSIWQQMRYRCNNPKRPAYEYYGGRGISVCDEWNSDYVAFRDWANSNGYSEGLTIDRKDVNGNYEPSNCRWVTMKEQMNNLRRNFHVTYNGETRTLSEWADILGFKYEKVYQRLHKSGWTFEKAISKP